MPRVRDGDKKFRKACSGPLADGSRGTYKGDGDGEVSHFRCAGFDWFDKGRRPTPLTVPMRTPSSFLCFGILAYTVVGCGGSDKKDEPISCNYVEQTGCSESQE